MTTERELPAYACHKRVRAARIKSFRVLENGVCRLWFKEDKGWGQPLDTREGWAERFDPSRCDPDLGVYVVYEDGFTSWSPSSTFDAGYKLAELVAD